MDATTAIQLTRVYHGRSRVVEARGDGLGSVVVADATAAPMPKGITHALLDVSERATSVAKKDTSVNAILKK